MTPILTGYRYIVFEGIDGVGKTTQLQRLATRLERFGITPIRLFEPTYGSCGLQARRMIAAGQMDRRDELHALLMLDRKEHVERKIAPILQLVRDNLGFVLLQDRCYLSAPAYQGVDDEDAMRLLREEQSYAPRPDAIVLMKVAPAVAIERLRKRTGDSSPFRTNSTLSAVQARYELVAASQNENVIAVNASGDEKKVERLIVSALEIGDGQQK